MIKPIEQVREGDLVASRNQVSGKTELRRVVATSSHTVMMLIVLSLADARTGKVVQTLTTTAEHPFAVKGKGFVVAGQLAIGNAIVTRAGPALVVKSKQVQAQPKGVRVYNFSVDGDQTYFVGTANGGTWVHNANLCPVGRGVLSQIPEIADGEFVPQQTGVSGPKIDEMVKMMTSKKWNWAGREIEVNGNNIMNGHHRYIAAKLAGIEPVMIPSNQAPIRAWRWDQVIVFPDRWQGGY